ncbi:MAG: lipoyl synthase, partial [Methylococcus sp.]
MPADEARAPSRLTPETHQRSLDKVRRIPIRPDTSAPLQPKPAWIRTRLGNETQVRQVKTILRQNRLHSVCEEAACPNLSECFSKGTATFMILGDLCTRRCPFCDVAHGRPQPPDAHEPAHLAQTIEQLKLRYVVITSVNRDDLRDGGAEHFAACIQAIRQAAPATRIEILTPDFRGRLDAALANLATAPPDVFNHNLETVPRLYKAARPGADYRQSLELLERVKANHPGLPTKSGIMLGLGETLDEVVEVMRDLR